MEILLTITLLQIYTSLSQKFDNRLRIHGVVTTIIVVSSFSATQRIYFSMFLDTSDIEFFLL